MRFTPKLPDCPGGFAGIRRPAARLITCAGTSTISPLHEFEIVDILADVDDSPDDDLGIVVVIENAIVASKQGPATSFLLLQAAASSNEKPPGASMAPGGFNNIEGSLRG
jgi:hypothetical protein